MAKTIPADEKVFMVSKTTNTTYSGSAALKAMNEWYTMDDVSNTVRPYKVFTALLTQSGGSANLKIENGELTIGVTYSFLATNVGDDFRNVGGPLITYPDEFLSYVFVATGTTPTNWTESSQLQYNTGAPVATVLENTIGNIWFSYVGIGSYFSNSNGLFTIGKTFAFVNTNSDAATSAIIGINFNYSNENINITSGDPIQGSTYDGYLSNTPIEIRVYN